MVDLNISLPELMTVIANIVVYLFCQYQNIYWLSEQTVWWQSFIGPLGKFVQENC